MAEVENALVDDDIAFDEYDTEDSYNEDWEDTEDSDEDTDEDWDDDASDEDWGDDSEEEWEDDDNSDEADEDWGDDNDDTDEAWDDDNAYADDTLVEQFADSEPSFSEGTFEDSGFDTTNAEFAEGTFEDDASEFTEGSSDDFEDTSDSAGFSEGVESLENDTGFAEGDTDGFTDSDTDGFSEGETGFSEGFAEGEVDDFSEGETDSFSEGDTDDFSEGEIDDFSEGETEFVEGGVEGFSEGSTGDFIADAGSDSTFGESGVEGFTDGQAGEGFSEGSDFGSDFDDGLEGFGNTDWGDGFNQEDNSGIFGDSTLLSLDDEAAEEAPDYEENVLTKAMRGKEAKKAYDETFDGVEQLEHSLFSLKSKLDLSTQLIPIKYLIPSEFKKQSRERTIIGLNGIVSQWGVVNPVHVMKCEDDDAYIILDGLRRVYAAMKNGLEEVECRVWDFENKVEGKKLANIISLMINRSERYKPSEQWAMMRTLERTNDLTPGLLEFLLQLEAGQAVKLRDIMQCEPEYIDIREKLIMGELDIESAFKKLSGERKKENRLQKEDMTSIENTVDETRKADKEKRRLSDQEVHDLLEMTQADVSNMDAAEMDMTDEIRAGDKYQTTDERHPVDAAVRQGTFMRDDFHCRCCGTGGVQWLGVLVFHHAVPVYAGGPDTIDNGLTLCQNCHMTLHNYIMGKVQVDLDSLSEGQRKVFRNIFKYGNIALEATKRKGLKKEDIAKLDRTGVSHAYPDANIKENTILFTQAAASKKSEPDKVVDAEFEEGSDIGENDEA